MEQRLAGSIATLTGIRLSSDKAYLLETRLKPIMQMHGLKDYDELVDIIDNRKGSPLTAEVFEAITTHETSFFRDRVLFECLTDQILPELARHQGLDRPEQLKLKVWCAGCSTGQEPYSLVMHLRERMPGIVDALRIVATDFAVTTLETARRATYTNFQVGRGLPAGHLERYFEPVENRHRVRDEVTRHVEFRLHNLIADPFPTGFDLVLCRNVVIYFEDHIKRRVYRNLADSLKPDGALILGASESLVGYMDGYVLRQFEKIYYYEMKSSNITLF